MQIEHNEMGNDYDLSSERLDGTYEDMAGERRETRIREGKSGSPQGRIQRRLDLEGIQTHEYILQKDPEVILILSFESRNRVLELKNKLGNDLAAVRQGSIFEIENKDVIIRPGPRIAEGIRLVASLIHPELFGNE